MTRRRRADDEQSEARERAGKPGKNPGTSPGKRDDRQTSFDKPDPRDRGIHRDRGASGQPYGRQTHGGQAYGRDGIAGQEIEQPADEPLREEDEVRDPTEEAEEDDEDEDEGDEDEDEED